MNILPDLLKSLLDLIMKDSCLFPSLNFFQPVQSSVTVEAVVSSGVTLVEMEILGVTVPL